MLISNPSFAERRAIVRRFLADDTGTTLAPEVVVLHYSDQGFVLMRPWQGSIVRLSYWYTGECIIEFITVVEPQPPPCVALVRWEPPRP